MRAYWVSTPRFTVRVLVDSQGRLTDVAPVLRRPWQGQSWAALRQWLMLHWGTSVRVEQLVDDP